MNMKKFFFWGTCSLSLVALLLSTGVLRPSEAKALTAEGLQDKTENWKAIRVSGSPSGKEDPHAKFRDGSRGSMMEGMMGMRPHASSKKKSHHSSKHSPFSAQGLKESLELDEDQAKKIKSVISSYRKESIRKNADLKIAQIEFDESVADKGFNLTDVEKKVRNREAFASALTMVRVKAMADARDILSEEQFDKFMIMITHRMSHHSRKGKHGMSGGGHGGKSSHSRRLQHGGGSPHSNPGGSGYED